MGRKQRKSAAGDVHPSIEKKSLTHELFRYKKYLQLIVYIGLGSNLGRPVLHLQTALDTLQNESQLQLLKVSSFYQSQALTLPGASPQNDYINAVAKFETTLSAQQLLLKVNEIETSQGRERKEKWGVRTLDLDILLYGEHRILTRRLVIPHAQIEFRNFVIHPLFEVAGAIEIPGLGNLAQLAKKTPWNGLQKIHQDYSRFNF